MVQTAQYDPTVVEPALTPDKIRELIGRGFESAKLDYKESFDPSEKRHKVALAKHAMAMANTAGGYIVVGVENNGTAVGLTASQAERLDEATLRAQVAGYCAVPIPLFVNNAVEHEGKRYAVVTVLPLHDRIAVAATDGAHVGGSVFVRGDVLVRHGSASERWNQDDADFILTRVTKVQKERWMEDFAGDFRRLVEVTFGTPSSPDIDESLFAAPADEFRATLLELIRRENG